MTQGNVHAKATQILSKLNYIFQLYITLPVSLPRDNKVHVKITWYMKNKCMFLLRI